MEPSAEPEAAPEAEPPSSRPGSEESTAGVPAPSTIGDPEPGELPPRGSTVDVGQLATRRREDREESGEEGGRDDTAPVGLAGSVDGERGPPASVGGAGAALSNTRSFRRRIGERRISATIGTVRAFVRALFHAVTHRVQPGGLVGGGTMLGSSRGMDATPGCLLEEMIAFVEKVRYRLTSPISNEVAAEMFAEADLSRDGILDVDELTSTAASCGIESAHLPRWVALFNLHIDPHSALLAMPLRVTKRHPIQSNSEATDDTVMFKPDLKTTRSHGKAPVTSRPARGAVRGQRRCDGLRDVTAPVQQLAESLNGTMGFGEGPSGGGGGGEAADPLGTVGFDALDAFSRTMRDAQVASEESGGVIARRQPHAGYGPRARPWLQAAVGELAWPAVPGSHPDTAMTLKDGGLPQRPLPPGVAAHPSHFNAVFHVNSNQDLRTEYAKEFLAERGPYAPPSSYQFREPGDPFSYGHSKNFQRIIGNREPSLRAFEPTRTGKYVPPSSHSFRPPSPAAAAPMSLVFAPKHKELDIGTGEKFARLPLDAIDSYLAHKNYQCDLTLSHMPRQMLSDERTAGPLL
eukprot:COSAG01_NODE_2824_length_7006_cov_2.795714_9_plen_576_part_00